MGQSRGRGTLLKTCLCMMHESTKGIVTTNRTKQQGSIVTRLWDCFRRMTGVGIMLMFHPPE